MKKYRYIKEGQVIPANAEYRPREHDDIYGELLPWRPFYPDYTKKGTAINCIFGNRRIRVEIKTPAKSACSHSKYIHSKDGHMRCRSCKMVIGIWKAA